MVGWCAHWRESLVDPDTKIIRPQQDYKGVWLRHYTPTDRRYGVNDSSISRCDVEQ
jgi:citrate synthase